MPNPNRVSKPEIEKSEQELFNKSFDREFDVLATESLIYNPTTNALDRNTGSMMNTLVTVPYDAITYTNTSTTVDTYRYYTGGTGGTLVATVTVTYSDPTTKSVLVSVVRT